MNQCYTLDMLSVTTTEVREYIFKNKVKYCSMSSRISCILSSSGPGPGQVQSSPGPGPDPVRS